MDMKDEAPRRGTDAPDAKKAVRGRGKFTERRKQRRKERKAMAETMAHLPPDRLYKIKKMLREYRKKHGRDWDF